ncbi:hypothetical protein B5G52_04100 [Pseudoalteromonas sp. A601]|uniref:tyrosine-type recombinase/integrase n=1 Tax=Pseudoalteromonas sp. A601 TaxID=1967839 RepID=UPI000B3CC297|nr:tyrosine-type recombinase/integrase [Pseudoalteromonas sp. A601]OUS73435.1 hypothetical protein B5G52_04100 [Pseudoalteromonas sp. A601]
MSKQNLDTFIEVLISNKLNECVRLTKGITDPLSATANSYFNRWFHETNAARYDLWNYEKYSSIEDTNKPAVTSYNTWISDQLTITANRDGLHDALSSFNPEEEAYSIDTDHEFYSDFIFPTLHSVKYNHLDNIVNNAALRIAESNNKNDTVDVRMQLDELQKKFSSLLPKESPSVDTEEPLVKEETFDSPFFQDIKEEYESYLVKSEGNSEKYVSNQKSVFQDVEATFNGMRLNDITHEILLETWVKICKLPRLKESIAKKYGFNVTGKFANAETKKQAMRVKRWQRVCDNEDGTVNLSIQEDDMLKSSTIKKYATCIKLIFKFARLRNYIKSNPIVDYELSLNVPKNRQSQRGMMPSNAAKSIIEYCTTNLNKRTSWAILLMIYSGARNSEIANLSYDDIITDPRTGVVYMYIRKGKTVNAERRIPLHKKLIELGFMSFVDSKINSKLFRFDGNYLTSYFSFFRQRFNIPHTDHEGKLIVLYSFRHSVITQIGNSTNEEIRYKLFGHGTRTVTAGYTELNLVEAQSLINLISY